MIGSCAPFSEDSYGSVGGRVDLKYFQNIPSRKFCSYACDVAGNLPDLKGNVIPNYTYDALDRLATAAGTGPNWFNQNYQYDRIGNITYKSEAGASGSKTLTYTYDYPVRPHAVKSILTIRSIYTDSTINIVYNYDQKPISITGGSGTTSFTYDGNGQRVKKVSPSETVYYFGEFYEKRGSTRIINLFAGNRRVASVWLDVSGNPQFTQFYHPDHLGSTNVVTDQNGNRAEWMEYFPFGTYRVNVDYASGFPDVFYTYTGQEEDYELTFYNFKARLYDPLLGRFISPDMIEPDLGDPQSRNRYAYCLNNPLIYTDPTGQQVNEQMWDFVDINIFDWPIYFDIKKDFVSFGTLSATEPLQTWIYITSGLSVGTGIFSGEGGTYYLIDPNSAEYYQFGYGSGGVGLSLPGSYASQVEAGLFQGPSDPIKISPFTLTVSGFAAWGKGYSGQVTGTSFWGSGEGGSSIGLAGGKGASIAGMLTYSWYVGKGEVLPEKYMSIYQNTLKQLPSNNLRK
jgi:RHS repeat-associated protein